MNKTVETIAKVLAGVGALNWGLAKLANFDLLQYVPQGIATTGAVAAIAASGGYLLYLIYQKKV